MVIFIDNVSFLILVSVTPETHIVPVAPLEAEEKRTVERIKEEVQIKQQEQVTLIDSKPQQVILEQRAAQPQRDVKDDWFILFDVSPEESGKITYNHNQVHTHT